MIKQKVTVLNRAGIHARPASVIVQAISKFQAHIEFQTEQETINAKSIMGVMTLGAGYKSTITIVADGKDEKVAVAVLVKLFQNHFEDTETSL